MQLGEVLSRLGCMFTAYIVVGQKENHWGLQILVYFSICFLLPIGFFNNPFLTHSIYELI